MTDLAIRMQGVCKDYPYFALQQVNLELPKGQVMGLIGPNGAGKSTSIRIMMGLVHQDSGDVEVLGNPMPAAQIATKWETGFASDDMRLYGAMTLEWHLDLMRRIYPTWDEPYAQQLLKRFGLLAKQHIKGISHGQRVKASLLLVLARRPKLLILDEPTTGLDPVARHEILREITSIVTDENRSVLFSSHNTLDIERICDQITFIDRGRIIDSLDKDTYMDRWRRLRLEIPSGASVPALPGVLGIRQTGRIAIVTVNAFQPDLPGAYESGGARVQAVETLTLEEIFVANVEKSREEVEA
jgi:ABC-2 type transport system ATP-binding protein